MNLEGFLERYNAFTSGEDKCVSYQLVHEGTGEVWQTLIAPLDKESVDAVIRELGHNFPSGKGVFRLQALADSKAILGQHAIAFHGSNNSSPRALAAEANLHARAMAANVAVTEQQLGTMQSLLDTVSTRALKAEEDRTEITLEMYKLLDTVQRLVSDKESRELENAKAEAEIEAMKTIAAQFAPVLSPIIMLLSKFVEKKLADFEENLNK